MQEAEAAVPNPSSPFVDAELDGDPGFVVKMESSKLQWRGIEEVEKPISTHHECACSTM